MASLTCSINQRASAIGTFACRSLIQRSPSLGVWGPTTWRMIDLGTQSQSHVQAQAVARFLRSLSSSTTPKVSSTTPKVPTVFSPAALEEQKAVSKGWQAQQQMSGTKSEEPPPKLVPFRTRGWIDEFRALNPAKSWSEFEQRASRVANSPLPFSPYSYGR